MNELPLPYPAVLEDYPRLGKGSRHLQIIIMPSVLSARQIHPSTGQAIDQVQNRWAGWSNVRWLIGDIQFKQHLLMKKQQISNAEIIRGRGFALMLLMFEIGIMFAYGYGSSFSTFATTNPPNDQSYQIILYTFTAILAILGYGLIVAYSQNSAIGGLTTTLFVVAISVQLSPLLFSFWYKVFNGFNGSNTEISLSIERETMILCTSLLVALTTLVGKLGKIETMLVTFLYNVGWALSVKVTQYIQNRDNPDAPYLYDDFGTNYVYVFAGFFALVTSLFLNCKTGPASPSGSRHSVFIGMIGTGFVFACFPFTGIIFPTNAAINTLRQTEGPLNIYFALTASVICTYISSAIFGKLKIGVRESLVGVLSGGVMIGVVGGTINNIGACIAIGAFAGLFSGFWLRVIYPRMNSIKSHDHMGIYGPILCCSIIGGLVVSPALYKIYYDLGTLPTSLGVTISTTQFMSYQLAYIGIAAGTAICTGILAGLISLCFRNPHTDFRFTKLVSKDFGLYRQNQPQTKTQVEDPNNHTASALKDPAAMA